MNTVLLSVIIPCHQSSTTLHLCLQSLSALKNEKRIEVLLVDNNADPETQKLIEGSLFLSIKETKQGASEARNSGAIKAEGEFLMFLDSDCIVPERFFEELLSILGTCRTDAYQVSIEPCDLNLIQEAPQARYDWAVKNSYTLGTFNACSVIRKIPLLDSACLIIKKDVFHELMGFPPLQRFEDRALGLKLFQQGRIVFPLLNLKVKKIISDRSFLRLLKNDWQEIKGQVWWEKNLSRRMPLSSVGSNYHVPRWSELKDIHLYLYHFLRKFLNPLFVWFNRLNPIKDTVYFQEEIHEIPFQVGEENFSFNTSNLMMVINSWNKITLIDKNNNQCTEIVREVSGPLIQSILTGHSLAPEDKIRDFLFLGLKKKFLKKI